MGYIDSHAHLTDSRLLEIHQQLKDDFIVNDIERVLIICCDKEDYLQAIPLADNCKLFDIAVGLHPESANTYTKEDLEVLEAQIQEKRIVAIGEIGLDYYWVKDNKQAQKELFIKQIELANKYNLPIIIHNRDASEDTYQILKEYPVKKGGVMHCYSGSVETSKRFIELGYYISLAGPVTFKNARHSLDVAKEVDLQYLMYETDCPYLTPEPFRGKLNNPNLVCFVANKIAEIRGIEVEELNKQVRLNYQRLFNND